MASRSRKGGDNDSHITHVQIDGLAMMKIIKHCHQDASTPADDAQGVLLGLIMENKLEVTNCFPFPRSIDGVDDDRYQLDMMRLLRPVNVDYLSVGWYQSASSGNYISRQLLESQQQYQESIEESFVIIYDPVKTAAGALSLKAYRLTKQAMELVKDKGYFNFDMLRNLKVGHENMFQELKVVIRNSHLVNALLSELSEVFPETLNLEAMDLGTAPVLQRHLRSIMDCTDEMSQFHQFQKQTVKQQLEKTRYQQRRNVENAARKARGEPPLPDEDFNFKPIQPPRDLEPGVIVGGQMAIYCQQINNFCSQALAKLFLVDSLHQNAPQRPLGQ
ncbi:Eukaryotic translation initiation factor 3 subunit H [Amphibalanus amphitrite]|uniref:Eukaryotic translation initiation factor 3 subunit H n=1 Tax=Amphibalanus amphitrite TaxID=1232801 RepID=A0A6A4VEW4_AMPAM|nr:Eukaryotic translation initiation factor 3 subunit H [Amphibalanus amphitrite]